MATVPAPVRSDWRRVLLWVVKALLVVWAGLWMVFPLAHLPEPASRPYAIGLLGVFVGLIAACVLRPRFGGVILVLAGAAAIWFLDHWFARAALGTPALVLGAAFVALGGRATRAVSRGEAAGSAPPPAS